MSQIRIFQEDGSSHIITLDGLAEIVDGALWVWHNDGRLAGTFAAGTFERLLNLAD
jgi:hypothetical protein